MALNLSTLTSPATSGEVLQEVLTTADFLESCPVLRNLSKGSNKGGDAKQSVSLNQPKALPLIDGDGYFYTSGVNGNYASLGATVLPATANFDLSIEFVFKGPVTNGLVELFYQYDSQDGRFIMGINDSNELRVFWGPVGGRAGGTIIEGKKHTARLVRSGSNFTLSLDGTSIQTWTSSAAISQVPSLLGYGVASNRFFKGGIFKVTEGSNYACDFTAANVRHGDTKFKCATGQVVTVNQSGNDPATVIKKSVLRFDGVNDGLRGLFNQTITQGYIFVAFTVLGDGGKGHNGRVFSLNSTGGTDNDSTGYIAGYGANPSVLHSYSGSNFTNTVSHSGLYSEENGDILHEHKFSAGAQLGKVNNADANTSTTNLSSISSEEFNVGLTTSGVANAAIDLEFLALFPATITDDQADSVRNYINNRNNVFDLKDGFGYYFYDAQKAPVGAISSGSSAWNGRIVGSDNGDTNKYATQSTTNDQPVSDGYVVTFADNSDHLDIPSTTQAGWQIVGTSLGTFVYRVNANAVTELNLLGNLGIATYRKAGDLYGIILLPESATGADIEAARKLLIDRGSSDAAYAGSLFAAWYGRADIVNFKHVDTSNVTASHFAWYSCNNLDQFPALDLSNSNRFESAWQNCSALTQFPAGAKLGTSASNVNFTTAFQSSGLTSFPALDLSKANDFGAAWKSCLALTTIEDGILLGTASSSVNFTSAFKTCTALTTLPSNLDLSKGDDFQIAFQNCQSLVNFPANAFDTMGTPLSSCFVNTWDGCSALSANSVENILVSIDTSGQSAPSSGPQITIDYNVATGTPAYSTLASLKTKGWSIVVNGVTL